MIFISRFIQSDHSIWFFVAFALAVQAAFVYAVANDILPENYYAMGRFYILLILASIYTFFRKGVEGLKKLIRPMLVWKISIWWYLFAGFWLMAFAILILFFKNLMNGEPFTAIPLTFTMFDNFKLLKGIFLASIIEEIVWVGLILTALQKWFPPLAASFILGIFWYLWWVPIIIYGEAVIPNLPVAILWFHYLGIAATCAWVYYHTKSGLIVAFMQMLTNAVSLVVPILPHLSDMPTYITFIIGKFIVAVLLFMLFGPKPLFRREQKLAY